MFRSTNYTQLLFNRDTGEIANVLIRTGNRIKQCGFSGTIASENAVEAVLVANDMPYIKTETYIDSEKMYLNLYETEVILNG